ncbi:MAG TPA: hypothetical protein VG754_13790 [Verrucomicrobiae bacterium]|nr:hypothetical protein [Verrucomicrobiae bacterium]
MNPAVSQRIEVDCEKRDQGQPKASETDLEILLSPTKNPLEQNAEKQELKKHPKRVRKAQPHHQRSDDAYPAASIKPFHPPAERNQPRGQQGERHCIDEGPKKLAAHVAKKLVINKSKDERPGERPFPTAPEKTGACIKRYRSRGMAKPNCRRISRNHTNPPGQPSNQPDDDFFIHRVIIPVGLIRRAQALNCAILEWPEVSLLRGLYPT